MEAFTDFILQVTYPPNPIRHLDNSLTADQAGRARAFFVNGESATGANTCNGCHALDPQRQPRRRSARASSAPRAARTFDFQPQLFKIPHLRNLYQKVGMFGMPAPPFGILPGDNDHKGDQVRGFGFLHDGSFDTVFRFMRGIGFSPFVGITIPEARFPIIPMASRTTRRAISSAATSSRSCSRSTAICSPSSASR